MAARWISSAPGSIEIADRIAAQLAEETSNVCNKVLGIPSPQLSTGVRIAAATWNLVQGIVLLELGYRWWALVLFAVSASIFWAATIFARRHSAAWRRGQS